MTPKERVIAQIEHKETDFIPYTLRFEEDSDKRIKGGALERVNSYYGTHSLLDKLDYHVVRVPIVNLEVDYEGSESFLQDMYGSLWRVDKRPYHLEKPALEEPSLEGYKFPDTDNLLDERWYGRAVELIDEKKDHFSVTSLGPGLFERTWALRGFENILMDVALHPDFYQELVRRIFEHQMAILEKALALPVDGVLLSDDYGHQTGIMIGAKRWRKCFKPYLSRMYERIHRAGKYTLQHMCGSEAEILPDLIEIGLDVYQSVQPEAKNNSPYRLKELYGEKITLWGGLGSQSVIPFGKPDEINKEVKKLCEHVGKGGGYILAPAKPIQPETPTENVVAIIEAFAEQAGICI